MRDAILKKLDQKLKLLNGFARPRIEVVTDGHGKWRRPMVASCQGFLRVTGTVELTWSRTLVKRSVVEVGMSAGMSAISLGRLDVSCAEVI
jgi:hypothetical protein